MKKIIFTLLSIMITSFYYDSFSQVMEKNSNIIDTNYKRSSLYTLMTTNPSRQYENEIVTYFVDKVVPDKYNNHNLIDRKVPRSGQKNELDNIVDYLNQNKTANKLVAKWFNRSENGAFDMNLIRERGYYDASILDITKSKSTVKGMAILADAGQELIDNTFILVNDSRYTNKEEVASAAKSILGAFTQSFGVSIGSEIANLGMATLGKGFVVKTSSHLFKLVWDEETQQRFYEELYFDSSEITTANKAEIERKKAAFDNATFFQLDYIGTDNSWADVQSTNMTTKTNSELIGKATVKSIDNVISKLQANYDVFKTKTPLFSTEPLCAKIGMKEGLTKKTKFEVLEQQMDENGTTQFVQIGVVKVDTKYPIWDNRYAADDVVASQNDGKTYFKPLKGKEFYPGLLLRQIK
jgi:hypothetical protein